MFCLSHGHLFWTPRQNFFGVMGLSFGPHRPILNDFLETKKMRNVRTIILAAVSSHIEPYGPISDQFWFPDFQTPPPAPDEFSDPNLSPLPTHPGIKYVARALAATNSPTKGDNQLGGGSMLEVHVGRISTSKNKNGLGTCQSRLS